MCVCVCMCVCVRVCVCVCVYMCVRVCVLMLDMQLVLSWEVNVQYDVYWINIIIYTSYQYLLCNLLTMVHVLPCTCSYQQQIKVLSYYAQWYCHILSAVNIGSTSVDLIAATLVATDPIVVTLQLVAADLHAN